MELSIILLLLVLVNLITGFKKPNGVLGCGLIGFSGSGKMNLPLIKLLMWQNSLTRGKHATGFYTKSSGLVKSAEEASLFINKDSLKDVSEDDNFFMGHVRHATVGDLKDPNSAHPFEFDNIVMMHNGTLVNYESLASKYKLENNWKVDSQVLGACLSQNLKDGNFDIFDEYTGAAAVVAYIKEDNEVIIYKDKNRPLFYGYLNETDMYFTSIPELLEMSGCVNIKSFEANTIYRIKEGFIIEEFKTKNKKAERFPFISRIISNANEIINYHYYQSKKFFCKNEVTGITYNALKNNLSILVGFKLRAISSTSKSSLLAQVEAGNYYKVESIDLTRGNSINVIGEDKVLKNIPLSLFNLTNFIPVTNGYVTFKPTDNKAVRNIIVGEIYRVHYFKLGGINAIIHDHNNDEYVTINTTDLIALDREGYNSYFKEELALDSYNESKKEDGIIITLPEAKNSLTAVGVNETDSDDNDDDEVTELIKAHYYIDGLNMLIHLVSDQISTLEDEKSIDSFKGIKTIIEKIKKNEDEVYNINKNSLKTIN